MIKLYGFIPSRANRPQWALEELGLDYVYYQLDFKAGDRSHPKYLAVNPLGKIPTLVDGDVTVFESAACCNYLGERHPESGLTPPSGSRERAYYDQWMFFIMTELEQPLWVQAKHTFALPEHLRAPDVVPSTHFEFKRAAKLLSEALGDKTFLVGDRFTCVDIMAAHSLRWAIKFEFPVEHDNLISYTKRHESRPAWGRMFKKETRSIHDD